MANGPNIFQMLLVRLIWHFTFIVVHVEILLCLALRLFVTYKLQSLAGKNTLSGTLKQSVNRGNFTAGTQRQRERDRRTDSGDVWSDV